MKHLLILRHAQAVAIGPNLGDHARPLTSYGEQDARAVGLRLQAQHLMPDRIVCSTARRAHQTAQLVAEVLGYTQPLQLVPELYHASPEKIVELAWEWDDAEGCVLLVAHNPALEDLITYLTERFYGLPPAGWAHVTVALERWVNLRPGMGRLESTPNIR